MSDIRDSIGLQFARIKALEGISEARKNLGFTITFFDSCSYCIARCVLQDLISIDVKTALLALDELTGELITDDILNNIFDNFCIGK